MFASFYMMQLADGRWPWANDRVKRVERGCARATEQQTHELMPCSPVAESELRVEITFSTFSTFSGAKDRVQVQFSTTGKDGY